MIWLQRIARAVAYLVLGVFALVTLGSLAPKIPVLGAMGAVLMAPFAPWIVILSLLGAVASGLRWRKTGSRVALVMAGLAGFAAIGSTVIQARQIAVARANGVTVNLAQTLAGGTAPHNTAQPVLVNYSSYQDRPLPLAIFKPAASADGRPAPIIVYVHGGGWGAGSLHDFESDMRWLADRGYLAISVEYPLSSKDRHLWNVVQPQIGCALAWIGQNAARFGGDPSRVALTGESAGGNLVLTTSYMANGGTLQPSCPGKPPRIGATVARYPIVDAVRLYRNQDFNAAAFARQMASNYTGGTPEQYPDRYALVSAATHVNPAAPPTLILLGLSDHLLPPAPANEFVAKARAAGIDARVIALPYAEHSFDLKSGGIGSQLVRQATLRFLAEHGLAPASARSPVL